MLNCPKAPLSCSKQPKEIDFLTKEVRILLSLLFQNLGMKYVF